MTFVKKLIVHAKEYTVTFRRFDDVIDPQYGAEYHGYYLDIQSQNATIIARRYDNEDAVFIQKGVNPDDVALVEDMRQIAQELFGIEKLLVLGSGRDTPYFLL